MGIRKDDKLNQLYRSVPEGVVIPSTWLTAQGYSPQLVKKYVQSGWLKPLGSRIYARPGQPVHWEGVVLGLQKLAEIALHLGGVSALSQQGFAHYLSLGGESHIQLWGQGVAPSWLGRLDLAARFSVHRRRLFSSDPESGWVELSTKVRDWTLRASSPERAMLEVLSEVDETESSFTFAAELFESLTTARPAPVSSLMDACTHLEAKRLFVFLGSYYQHSWLKKIDVDALDLGKGKRMVTRGGRYDKRFRITVPEGFHAR
jgi:hypothetical protein